MSTTPGGERRPIHWHDDKRLVKPMSEDLPVEPHGPEGKVHGHGGGHALMMLACCIPMVLVVLALVGAGVLGWGAVLYALLCVVMMASMMLLMPGHRH